MPKADATQIGTLGDLLSATKNAAGSMRNQYMDNPIALGEKLGLQFPEKPVNIMMRLGVITEAEAIERFGAFYPGIRDLVQDVCSGAVESAVGRAGRGTGKSQSVSFIEFFLVFFKDFDALNLGGSELQADQVYQYIVAYIDTSKEFQDMVRGDPIASKTTTKVGAWIRVLTASSKSVRSPHAGGKKPGGRMAGGLLVIDEEAEAAPDIVAAALPTINTARPSVNVRISTFHNAEGSFQEVVDNADEMGYTQYFWDIFDVAEKCDCIGSCQSEEPCFREDHYETYVDPDSGKEAQRLLHKAYCGGRAMYADGWISMREIVKLWLRGKRNHSTWEVEAMGSRPSSKGFVIRDQIQFKKNMTKLTGAEVYMPGWPVTVCIDWGTRHAGLEVWQEQPGDRHALIHCEQIEEAGITQIIGAVLGQQAKYSFEFKAVAADIGGGGNYLNPKLREEHRINVLDINFAEVKESAAAALNVFSESSSLIIPEEFALYWDQAKKWKRVNGRIQKGNDHLMDAGLCYFAQFIDRLGLNHIRVPPRSISSASGDRQQAGTMVALPKVAKGRIAVIRSLGGAKRR